MPTKCSPKLEISAVHARREHEVVEDQLAPALEHVDQPQLVRRAPEDVVLVDPHPGQAPALGGEGIVLAGEPLLLLAYLLKRLLPVGLGDDVRSFTLVLLRVGGPVQTDDCPQASVQGQGKQQVPPVASAAAFRQTGPREETHRIRLGRTPLSLPRGAGL